MSSALADILRHDLRTSIAMADPVDFARQLGYDLDLWQQDVIKSDRARTLILASRQSGKSFVCALLGLWTVLNEPGSTILILSPSQRQSALLFTTILDLYKKLGRPISASAERLLSLELSNGSKIYALPGTESTTRGYKADLLILDESAWIDDEIYAAARPFVALGGRTVAIGTGHGRRGWFFRAYSESSDWYKLTIPATKCQRISAEFLAEERRNLGEWWFNSEYMCIFGDAESSVFTYDMIQAAISNDIEPWDLDSDVRQDSESAELYGGEAWELETVEINAEKTSLSRYESEGAEITVNAKEDHNEPTI